MKFIKIFTHNITVNYKAAIEFIKYQLQIGITIFYLQYYCQLQSGDGIYKDFSLRKVLQLEHNYWDQLDLCSGAR